jgi:hypothetical protein
MSGLHHRDGRFLKLSPRAPHGTLAHDRGRMDDWNVPTPAATTVNGPAPNHPSTLTNPLARARPFMDGIEATCCFDSARR